MEQNQSHLSQDGEARDVEKKDADRPTSSDGEPKNGGAAKKAGFGQRLKDGWSSLGLDIGTLMTMFKAAVGPTIATAFYQSTAVAQEYSTLGYLVCIVTILGFPIMPRAKFIQTMMINLVAICFGGAMALFAIWTSIKARQHTLPADSTPTGYNSSASAVCAVWLFFFIYVVSSLKSARPQLNFPVILISIFIIVAMTYGPQFPTMATAESFVRRLLIAFSTGFGIATGVSLLVFPVNSRTVVFKEITGCLQAVTGVLKAQSSYMSAMENEDMFRPPPATPQEEGTEHDNKHHLFHRHQKAQVPQHPLAPQAAALKGAAAALVGVYGKLHGDLTFGKREIAYGKLDGDDISEIFKQLRLILLPVVGLSSIIDIFNRLSAMQGWDKPQEDAATDASEQQVVHEWQDIMKTLHEPFAEMTQIMNMGIDHVLLALEFQKPPKSSKKSKGDAKSDDIEAKGELMQPGQQGFAKYMDKQIVEFYQARKVTLYDWCESRNISLSFENPKNGNLNWDEHLDTASKSERVRGQKQLFAVLYMEWLLYCASRAVYDLVLYADKKIEDGTMKRTHLIYPSLRRTRKWIMGIASREDSSNDDHQAMGGADGEQHVNLGDSFGRRHDPEHLPAESTMQKLGDYLRAFPRLLSNKHSVFGFRVACATISIAIVAYLKDSYMFFIQQRLIWALIMISFSMTRTAGQSLFTFVLRVGGTLVAMVGSFICWYIVDGQTAGVIVFQFLWIMGSFWVVIKKPKYVVAGIISAVTTLLILSYELQVRKIGVAAAEASGQPAYPIYVLAPYRLATVAGGIFVAYVWTMFPYPTSEHSELRSNLGAALYLLANFYSIVHETVGSRVRGDAGDITNKNSPGYQLEKARNEVYAKLQALITNLKSSSEFTQWQIHIGGRFPRETYDAIIEHVQNVLNYSGLIGFASRSFTVDGSDAVWTAHFKQLLTSVDSTTHDITSILSMLSNSMSSGQALPPYLKLLEPYHLAAKLEEMDHDIMSIEHITEPGYAAFAVVQVASRCIVDDINQLVTLVKKLVGELDFSFHTVSTSAGGSTRTTDSSTLTASSSGRSAHSSDKGKRE